MVKQPIHSLSVGVELFISLYALKICKCVCVSILFLVNNPISSNNISIFGRREGYEFMVGPPKVINKKVNDKVLEPYEIATVEVPEEHMGVVVELLGKRRGQMFDMQGVGSE
ncbi:hypothetical protein P8452_42105 [Trifolium repens]|nr:hypothetical protein P8452_42105 [Trifolium repens]